ncbi:MAG: universal stress protein [Planctomycetota bacterium]|jgi:nucleotide-binding universal stress UspA family protein
MDSPKTKHIVLTTDLSEDAQRPFAPVSELAKKLGARITLLHTIQLLTEPSQGGRLGTPVVPPDYESETRNAERALEKLAESLPSDLDVSVRVVTCTNTAESIAQYAEEHNASLVALSTHGRTGVRRLVLGSVAEGVLRHSSVPVLCFPQGDSDREDERTDIRGILLTTDLSSEALRPFSPVLELAKSLGARITALHVVSQLTAIPYGAPLAPPITSPDLPQEVEKAQRSLEEQCSSLGSGVDLDMQVISHESPAKGIVEFARKHEMDLIALSTHGRTGFRRLALGSVADDVLRDSSVPVLSFHRTEN